MGQWLHPLKPDLALMVNAAQRNGDGHVWQGHMHLGDPGCDLDLLVPRRIHDTVAGMNGDRITGERGLGTNLGFVCHALGGARVPNP